MSFIRLTGAAVALCVCVSAAAAQECAWGQRDGGSSGYTFEGLPDHWTYQVFENVARATGMATLYGSNNSANTLFEISRKDAAARKDKAYRTFVEISYFPTPPPPRSLKATLEIGGSTSEFTVDDKEGSNGARAIDLAPLYPKLIGAIRNGEVAHLTIFDGDKKFIEQYFNGKAMKSRFDLMEGYMEGIFAIADAGKCPDAPEHAPISGKGSLF